MKFKFHCPQIKFYWNSSQPCSFVCTVYGCFHTTAATALSSSNRDCMVHKAQNVHYLALVSKSLLTPALTHHSVMSL